MATSQEEQTFGSSYKGQVGATWWCKWGRMNLRTKGTYDALVKKRLEEGLWVDRGQ
jgi:hypothetical protein